MFPPRVGTSSPEVPLRMSDQRSLYLCIQGPTQASIDKAVQKIHEIINISYTRSKMPRFSGPPPGWPGKGPPPLQTNQPLPLMSFSAVPTELLQDKVFVGLDHAPPTFDVKNRILGAGGSYLQHVETETMARVTLRGKGSDYIEPNGSEAFEPLHVQIQHPALAGLQQAKQLAENLVLTVQQDFAQFQLAFVGVPPPNVGPPPQLPGTAPLFALPPPIQVTNAPPGGNISLLAPQQSPQTAAFITSMTPSSQGLTVIGQPSQPEMVSPGAVGLPAAIISNPTVLVNTSVPPPNFLPQQAPSIQSHIIHLGTDPTQGPPPGGLALTQPQVILQPGVSLQPGPQQITLQPGASPPNSQPVLLQQQPPPQQQILVQQATPPAGWPPGQPPPQGLTTTSIAPEGWVQTSPQGQVLQVVHQLVPPGVVSAPVLSTPPPSQPQQQFYPMLINQQVPPPPIQLTPGGQVIAPMSQPLPESGTTQPPPQLLGQPPEMLGQPPQVLGQSPQALPPQYNPNPGQVYNIQYVSAASTPPSVSPSLATTPTSGSPTPANTAPPTLPQKRRFTEEKPPLADTENLLGYQHGPPHLMGTLTAPPPATSSPSTVLPQQSVTPPQLGLPHPSQPPPSGAPAPRVNSPGQGINFDMMAPPPPPPAESRLLVKPEVSRDDCKSGLMAMPMPPLPPALAGRVQQGVNDLDTKLMPPPPPPPTGQDRGPPERKKSKGNAAGYPGEEEDDMKAILQRQQETAAYSFNQYSSKPQIYMDQAGTAPDPTAQYSIPGPPAPPQSYDQQLMQQPPPATGIPPAQNGGLPPPPPQMVLYQDANGVTRQVELEQAMALQACDVNAPQFFHPATGQQLASPQTLEAAPPTGYITPGGPGGPVTPVAPPPPPGPPPQQQQQQQQFWGLHQQQLQQQQLSVEQPGWSGDQKRVQSPLQQQQGMPQNSGQFGQPPPPPPPQTTPYYQSQQQYLPQY